MKSLFLPLDTLNLLQCVFFPHCSCSQPIGLELLQYNSSRKLSFQFMKRRFCLWKADTFFFFLPQISQLHPSYLLSYHFKALAWGNPWVFTQRHKTPYCYKLLGQTLNISPFITKKVKWQVAILHWVCLSWTERALSKFMGLCVGRRAEKWTG